MGYTILESRDGDSKIKVRVKTVYDIGHDKYLEFAPDRRSLTETLEAMGVSVDTTWEYADSRTKPD